MDLEIIILTEVSQTTERKVAYDIAYTWILKKKKKNKQTYLQNRSRVKGIQKKLVIIHHEIS